MYGADLGFRTRQVGRSYLHRCCSKSKSRNNAARIGDTASGDDRHLHSVDNLRDERHRTRLPRNILAEKIASVSTGFVALSNDSVTSSIFQPARFIDRSGRGNDLRPCISNPSNHLLFRKAEMKADNLWMEFDDEVAHLIVERRPVGARNGHVLFEPKLHVVALQALSPDLFPICIGSGRGVTKEIPHGLGDWSGDVLLPVRCASVRGSTRHKEARLALRLPKPRQPF